MFTIISWHTFEYKDIINEYFLPSVQKLNIPYKIYLMNSLKNWQKNTCLKPIVIEKAFEEINTDLLIIDADACIYNYPQLLDEIPEEYDCALFWLNWNEFYRNGRDIKQLASGTLYFRNRIICRRLIERWKEIGQTNNIQDQVILAKTLPEFPDLKIYKLPYEMCWINSIPGNRKPLIKRPKNVVIEHFQKSREMKRSI